MSAKLTTIEAALGRLGSTGQRTGASMGQLVVGFGAATIAANALMGAAGAIAGSFVNAGKGALDLSSRLEQARIGFTTMLGSAQKADTFIGQLQQKAESTAFSFPGLQQTAQSFLAMGIEAKNVIPLIDDVSNALSAAGHGGDTDRLQRVGQSLSEIAAQGKITAEQLRELSRNGIAVLPLLAEAFGKTTAEVRKMAENGEISANMFFEAFHSEVALHYGDIQAQQAKTWAVAASNVGDILGRLSTQTFKEFFDTLTQGALLLNDFLHSERAAAWAADMKSAIHEVMAALAPLGKMLADFVGGSGVPAAAAGARFKPPPDTFAKANWQDTAISPDTIKSAKDYDAQIKAATADIHDTTEALTALGAQQQGLKDKIEDTTKIWDLRLTGLKDQQAAIGVEIEATKTHYEGILDPLNRMQAQLQRLGEDTKASFAAILDPLKSQLFDVNRQIADSKIAFESVVRPIQSQIDAITRANAALAKQRDLVIRIADLNLRESQLKALGDPGQRGDIAARLQALQFTQDDLERQKELLDLANKKGENDKRIAAFDDQLKANRAQQIKLEQEAANLVNRGLTEQNTKQGIVNDATKTGLELAQARADIATQKQLDPLQAQLDATQARLKAIVDPLEAQAAGLSRAIEDVGIKEAAALAPITAAQESVARKIQDTNQALQEALKPLEDASKAIAAQITAAEAGKAAALAPLKDELDALDRKSNALELHKRQQADLIAGWKDEKTAIADAAAELAKNAPKLDLSGGAAQPAPGTSDHGPFDPPGYAPPPSGLALKVRALAADFKVLAANVQASADAFNNLNVATSGGLVGGLVEVGRAIGVFLAVGAGWSILGRIAAGLAAISPPALAAQLAITALILLLTNQQGFAIFLTDVHNFTDDFGLTLSTAWGRTLTDFHNWTDELNANWNAFWIGLGVNAASELNKRAAEIDGWLKERSDAWTAWDVERTAAWNAFWIGLGTGIATELSKRGAEIDAQFAAWKGSWDAWGVERTASWNAFWAGLGAGAQAGWDILTGWLEPAVAGIVKVFEPLAAVLKTISDAITKLPSNPPAWLAGLLSLARGGSGGQNVQTSLRTGGQSGGWSDVPPGAIVMMGGDKDEIVRRAAEQFHLDLGIFSRQIQQESGSSLDTNLTSSAGARGPGQFMPGTAQEAANMLGVSIEEFWNSAELQILGAAAEMQKYVAQFGSYRNALIAYNAGPGAVGNYLPGETASYLNTIMPQGEPGPWQSSGDGQSMQNLLVDTRNLTGSQMDLASSTDLVTAAQNATAQADAVAAQAHAQLTAIVANGGQVTASATGPLNALAAAQQQSGVWANTMAAQQANLTKVLQGQADPLRNTKDAMTEFGSVLGPIERQVAGGTVGGLEGLEKQLVDLARATGLATKPWADYTNGLISIDEAMARVINQASDAGPEFDALRQAQTATGADAQTSALNFLQAALHYRDAQAAIVAAPVVPATPAGAVAAAPATLDTGPIKAMGVAWDETKAKADAAGLSVRAYQDIVNILDTKQITTQTEAWNAGTEAVNKFSDAAHQIGDYLDSHEFHFKATFDSVPSDYKPGSPSPLENALRGIIDAGEALSRIRIGAHYSPAEPNLSPAARQGALASSSGGRSGETHYHIAIEGNVLTEDQLLTRFRDGLIKHSRRNGGKVWD